MSEYAEVPGMSDPDSRTENPDDWMIKGFPKSTKRLHARLDEMELREATPNFRDQIIPLLNLDLEDRTLTLSW